MRHFLGEYPFPHLEMHTTGRRAVVPLQHFVTTWPKLERPHLCQLVPCAASSSCIASLSLSSKTRSASGSIQEDLLMPLERERTFREAPEILKLETEILYQSFTSDWIFANARRSSRLRLHGRLPTAFFLDVRTASRCERALPSTCLGNKAETTKTQEDLKKPEAHGTNGHHHQQPTFHETWIDRVCRCK